jgi:hypothetical protein
MRARRRSPWPPTGPTCTPGRCSSSPATRRWRCSTRWSWRSPRRSGGWRSAALPGPVQAGLATLREAAAAFLQTGHPAEEARRFCTECIAPLDAEVLGHLLDRDGRILRRLGGEACPGPAFRAGGCR